MVEIGNGINWDDFRPKLDILFCNNTEILSAVDALISMLS